ncbi:hypothetical protein [Arthrobacter sp. ok362]|uniref:hypothetical protein n=1 Tax=Arthrobacter sp. ok362 TaxID=1761745 RepID=UPI0008870337|nr:hypothetical protein [Arthrobacter sp. ok362]SDK79807.1 hypothetical protein SAMN04487913_103215 [Arthrobacter sp. ok362]
MSENTLLDTLNAHQPDTGHRDLHQHCTCGWFGRAMQRDFLQHQADALDAAGHTQQPETAEAEWGVANKWGSRSMISKQSALDYKTMCDEDDEPARLIKRRAASQPGPWEDAE